MIIDTTAAQKKTCIIVLPWLTWFFAIAIQIASEEMQLQGSQTDCKNSSGIFSEEHCYL